MAEVSEKKQNTYIPTGCTLLDLVIGGGSGMGWCAGTIVNLIGDKSAGKSFLKNETIAAAHYMYGNKLKRYSDDTESGDTFDTSTLYGIDIHPEAQFIGKTAYPDTETVEELDAKVGVFLDSIKENEVGIYAIDSLDGLTDAIKVKMEAERQKLLESGKTVVDKGDYGMNIPKFLSQHFFKSKHNAIKHKNALLMIVSQIRDKLDAMAFQQKWEVSGGKALEFYCHTRLFLSGVTKIMRGGKVVDGKTIGARQVGAVIEARTIKSKTPRPFRSCRLSFYFDYGIDNIGSNLDFLYDLRGADGQLLGNACKNIPWDAKEDLNFANLTEWVKANELYEPARAAKKEETGKITLNMEWLENWILLDPEREAKFRSHFGKSYTRDELIQAVEADRRLEKELERRVIAKWEQQEEEIKTDRKPKY